MRKKKLEPINCNICLDTIAWTNDIDEADCLEIYCPNCAEKRNYDCQYENEENENERGND